MAKVEQEVTIKVTMDSEYATDAREWDWTELIGDDTVIVSGNEPVVLPEPERFSLSIMYKGLTTYTKIWETPANNGTLQEIADWLSASVDNINSVRGGVEGIKIDKIS